MAEAPRRRRAPAAAPTPAQTTPARPARQGTRTAPADTPAIITSPRSFPALDALVAEVSGRYKTDAILRRGTALQGFNLLETNIFLMDLGLLGGIAEGTVAQLYGWEASGKTTLAMRLAATAQRKHPDKAVIFVDAEHTFDPIWASHHGVDPDRLYVVSPESGEQAVDIIEGVLRNPETAMVVLDSLPALVPQAEIDASTEDALVAKRSQLIGRCCSKILSSTQAARSAGNNPTTIFINQFRMKIGVVHGDPRNLPGGMQPKYLSTTMIECKKKKEVMGKDESGVDIVDYNEHAFAIKKSKVGNSLREGEFQMVCTPLHPALGQGAIDEGRTVVTYAKRMGYVSGGGASWRLHGVDHKFGKMDDIVQFLYAEPHEMLLLKALMVARRRADIGLLPVPIDGYLMGVTAEDLLPRM
ncbi:hypothetical protein H10PHJ05_84 [Aeromonas phage HJ05]|nr:hypothetical protein H10PHJ05_84 [Aeromonas phage HJ05]